jgi:hypothetical protein
VVFFVISRKGFENYWSFSEKFSEPLWVSASILSESELNSLRCRGADVTDFNYEICLGDNEVIDDAVETIKGPLTITPTKPHWSHTKINQLPS